MCLCYYYYIRFPYWRIRHMIKSIHKNYQAFYDMLIVTTALSNNPSPEFDKDAHKIIDFIGQAYGLNDELIKYIQKAITDELVSISTKDDVSAFINSHSYEAETEEIDSLLMAKCDALTVVESLGEVKNVNLNPDWFNYSHYKPYYPIIRYRQLALAASTGNPIANKVVAILSYLGIGVDKSDALMESAIYRLRQCVVWGDVPAIYILKHIYQVKGKKEEEKLFAELIKLVPYMNEGRTVLPKEVADKVDKKVLELFAIISSIKQDVVINEGRIYIDYSFAEVMLSEDVSYHDKLAFINRYRYQEWKEATNSSYDESKQIGFKIGD